jgi:hypothetical protein
MTNGFLKYTKTKISRIYSYIRKPFLIYDCAPHPFRMSVSIIFPGYHFYVSDVRYVRLFRLSTKKYRNARTYGGRSLQGVTELLIREEEISLDENFTLSFFPRFLYLPSFNSLPSLSFYRSLCFPQFSSTYFTFINNLFFK